ncbi:hypothetical protein BC567DRAFT_228016 [Phyllosticta citribraziliensis]
MAKGQSIPRTHNCHNPSDTARCSWPSGSQLQLPCSVAPRTRHDALGPLSPPANSTAEQAAAGASLNLSAPSSVPSITLWRRRGDGAAATNTTQGTPGPLFPRCKLQLLYLAPAIRRHLTLRCRPITLLCFVAIVTWHSREGLASALFDACGQDRIVFSEASTACALLQVDGQQ